MDSAGAQAGGLRLPEEECDAEVELRGVGSGGVQQWPSIGKRPDGQIPQELVLVRELLEGVEQEEGTDRPVRVRQDRQPVGDTVRFAARRFDRPGGGRT